MRNEALYDLLDDSVLVQSRVVCNGVGKGCSDVLENLSFTPSPSPCHVVPHTLSFGSRALGVELLCR